MSLLNFRKKPLLSVAVCIVVVGGIALLLTPIIVGMTRDAGYPLAPEDTISSWNLSPAYPGDTARNTQIKNEITRLSEQAEKEGTDRYDLYVGIASQYQLLGDGKSAHRYLSDAVKLAPSRALAYFNIGHLMEQLGALTTARRAYQQAVNTEPNDPLYTESLKAFTTRHPNIAP